MVKTTICGAVWFCGALAGLGIEHSLWPATIAAVVCAALVITVVEKHWEQGR
jgi:hypothetical protein